jgi:predicted ATPase
VEVRVLGPLELLVDGTPRSAGGPKPRALLATLALQPGAVVSTDRLLEAVWGAHAPPGAVRALRAYVSRLRTVLPDGEKRLRYRAPGYLLNLGDDELDTTRFTALVQHARTRAELNDHTRVVELLDAALGLWRGEPLSEFDPAAVDPSGELTRLADLRLIAVEERAEALLGLGRGREVIAELDGLVRCYPERERLSVLLMRVLYAAGRQADALAVYRELRRRLVDEFGVEPAESTRQVHHRLLRRDPELTPRSGGPPTNLPNRATEFVDRRTEIAEISTALGSAPLVTLTGPGGIGKSRLALEVATRVRPDFPDGVWLAELAPLPDRGPVGEVVAAALGVRQGQGTSLEQSIVEFLRPRRLLLLLDNCEHVLDEAARLVAAVLARCPGAAVLATSREALTVSGEQVRPVPPLPAAQASELFTIRARATRPDFDAHVAEGAVEQVCRRLDGLPLAIELAAARMRAMTVTDLADRLDDARLLTHGPRTEQPRHQSLTAAIDWSYRLLTTPEQQLFARMSVFAGGADLRAVHAVCAEPGTGEIDTLELVTALVDKSLVVATTAPAGMRYSLLETLRAFGRDRLPAARSLSDRHAGHVLGLATRAAEGVHGSHERSAVDQALADAANIRAAFEHLHATRDVDRALALVSALPEVLQIRLGYEAAGWAERALALATPDHPLFVQAVGAAARGAWNLGEFDRSRAIAGKAGGRRPPRGTARTGYPGDVLADIALYEGDVAAALRHYTAEVAEARHREDPIRLVWTLYYVAVCQAVRRTPGDGLDAARESLRVARATANPTALSMAYYAVGLVLKKSEPSHALELLGKAARLAGSVRNFWWQGIAMMEAAATRAVHGDAAVAAAESIAVLDHWERVGDRTQQWLNLRYILRLLVRLGAHHEALVLHHCLLAAGKPSALDQRQAQNLLDATPSRAAAERGAGLSPTEAVALARCALARPV